MWWLVKLFPSRCRVIYTEGEPYLLRFYVKKEGILPGIYLHFFFKGDSDRALHNHPWRKAVSLILTHGYYEEYLDEDGKVYIRELRPFRLNIIKGNTFHRVFLKKTGHPWTLFMPWGRFQDWGFRLSDGAYIPHDDYIKDMEKGPTDAR